MVIVIYVVCRVLGEEVVLVAVYMGRKNLGLKVRQVTCIPEYSINR